MIKQQLEYNRFSLFADTRRNQVDLIPSVAHLLLNELGFMCEGGWKGET